MLLLAPEVWRHGGIQRYMKMILRIAEAHQQPCDVLSLMDDADRASPQQLTYIGCSESRAKYCWEALRLAMRGKAREIIVGHVGLLPIAWMLRLMRFTEEYTLVLHGIEAWQRMSWIHRVAARAAKSIIATTAYTAREFCYFNRVDRERCVIIPLACDIQVSQFNRPAPQRELRLMTVSRLTTDDRYKGLDCLLAAVRLGLDYGLALQFQIIGNGDDLERLRHVARSLEIQDVILFRGALADSEMEEVYAESHVFAMPSKKEGFGIVYLEAMAAGLPCIAANHGGVPEVVEHGKTGFLVEYGDARQIVFYLRALLESPELYDSLSRGARLRVGEDLGFAAMADAWVRVFKMLQSISTAQASPELKDRPEVVGRQL